GDQLDAIWLDELRNIELLRTLRGRMIDRGGIIIVTFSAIDENYTAVVNEYERGARTVFEVDAKMLPIKRPRNAAGTAAATGISAGNSPLGPNEPLAHTQKEPDKPGSPAETDFEIIGYEKVPRIKVAGPGTDGNQ